MLHFPSLCLCCVCHNSRCTKYFLISCNEELVLKIYRTDDAKSLVQRLCEIVTNKLSSDTTVYCIQFIACTCQISEGMKQKILRCYKYPKQNKKRNSNEKEEILCSTRTRKKKENSVWRGFVIITIMLKTKRKTAKTHIPVSHVCKKKSKGRARLHMSCLVFGQLPHKLAKTFLPLRFTEHALLVTPRANVNDSSP